MYYPAYNELTVPANCSMWGYIEDGVAPETLRRMKVFKAQGYQGPLTKQITANWTKSGLPLTVQVMEKEITPGITAVVALTGAGLFGTRSWGYLIGPTAEERGIAFLAVRTGIIHSAAEKLEMLAQLSSGSASELGGLAFRVHKLSWPVLV